MKNFVELKKVLLGGASVVAVGMFMGPALAQAQLETVVVTGIRASLSSAQSIKQNSDQVVDSITAVDIGALPDRNVADALQRVPGVTLQRTDQNRDPVRYGGTGNSVYIRGLSWVSNLTNGRDTFSAANGRSLSFADVSANLLSGVDVYKNPTAKMIEGGIGGTVDLKTRKPFDAEGRLLAFSADYTYGDLISKGTPSANALFSDRWSTGIGEIGALISVDWQDQKNRTNGTGTNWNGCDEITATGATLHNAQSDQAGFATCQTSPVGITAGHHVYVPNYGGYRQVDWQQQRFATDAALQWRPNEKLEITFEALNAIANPHDTEYAAGISISTAASDLAGYTYAPDGTWTGGNVHNVGYAFDTRVGKHHNRTTDLSLTAKYNPNDSLAFNIGAAYTESVATNYSLTAYTYPDTSKTDVLYKFDLTGDMPTITSASAGLATKANYGWLAAMDHMEDNYAHSFAVNADGTYTFHGNGFNYLTSVDFGFRAQIKQAITRQTGYNWAALSPAWGPGWGPLYLDNTYNPAHWDPTANNGSGGWACAANIGSCFQPANGAPSAALTSATHLQKFNDFLGGSVPSIWMVNADVLSKGMAPAYNLLKTAENVNWGWQPYSIQAGCTTVDIKCYNAYSSSNPRSDNQNAGVNNQKENTYAGYLQVNYGHDSLLGMDVPVDGNIGLRIVRTEDETGAGKANLTLPTTTCTVGQVTPTGPITTCADYNAAIAWSGGQGGTVVLPAVSNGYTDILPSFNFRAHLTDQVQARLAYSVSMVRPDFSYTTNYAQVGFSFFGTGPQQGTFNAVPSGSAGNVGLKPMKANNYDASIEWYFAPTGSLTLSLFHKDISNYFFTTSVSVPVTHPVTHNTMNFLMITTENGKKGKVEGFELAYQQFYDSLPGFWGGFGIQANYTKIYNSGGANPTVNLFETQQVSNAARALPMEGMSPDSYNLALLYEKYGISARMAYNWRSRFLLTSSAANLKQPVWSDNYGQLDGSLLYSFMDNYKVGIQVTNITKQTTRLEAGYADFYRPYDWIETDRKYSIILRTSW